MTPGTRRFTSHSGLRTWNCADCPSSWQPLLTVLRRGISVETSPIALAAARRRDAERKRALAAEASAASPAVPALSFNGNRGDEPYSPVNNPSEADTLRLWVDRRTGEPLTLVIGTAVASSASCAAGGGALSNAGCVRHGHNARHLVRRGLLVDVSPAAWPGRRRQYRPTPLAIALLASGPAARCNAFATAAAVSSSRPDSEPQPAPAAPIRPLSGAASRSACDRALLMHVITHGRSCSCGGALKPNPTGESALVCCACGFRFDAQGRAL